MRIDQLQLTGFRCFEQATFDFQPQFNLIVGENGSGKTSLLEALAVASGAWLTGIRGYDGRPIEPEDVRIVPHGANGEMTFEEVELTEVRASGRFPDDGITAWARSRKGTAGRTTRKEASEVTGQAEAAEAKVRGGKAVILPLISYYGTGRLWDFPKDMKRELKVRQTKADLSRFEGYRTSVDRRCSPVAFAKWLRRQAWIAFQEEKETALGKVVKAAVVGCLEGGKRIWFSAKREQVLVEIAGHGVLPFENLSDGQRTMVAMVGDIAIKAAQLNPHLVDAALKETPGIVLIDELDLHLHPRWQRRVVHDLKRCFPRMQFFCTTHSPQIIGEARKEEVMILNPHGATTAPVAFGADTNWILRHVMGGEERNSKVRKQIEAVDEALDNGELERAKQGVAKLLKPNMIGTSDEGEVARLESSIRNLEALAHADD
jgi:predicted ATP-binding protein involved in virulence